MLIRHRRLRARKEIRDLVRETRLDPSNFIYPLFVVEGVNIKEEISSMPGTYRYSVDSLPEIIEEIISAGIKGVIIFGIPSYKDEVGSSAYICEGIVQKAVIKIKEIEETLWVITDVCMCEYTSHGHCGIVHNETVDNDETLLTIAKIALSHAVAGADMVAPSDMMDGRVAAIRDILDANGFQNIGIMAYSAKYCSAFYGPFREAADSAPKFGDRNSYQMDPANGRMALNEIEEDIKEGADIIMIKPALSYLDIICKAREKFSVPIAAYSVSGEYTMIKSAAKLGYINERAVALETLLSIKRAGADMIITYYALEAALWLKEK